MDSRLNLSNEKCWSRFQPSEDGFCQPAEELTLSCNNLRQLMEGVFSKNALFKFQAGGNSMHPFVKNFDILTISPYHKDSPQTGDIVAFTGINGDRLIVHRIIGKQKNRYLIKGDNNFSVDGYAARDRIIGKVVRIDRDGRKIRIGIGIERYLIAALSRRGGLHPLMRILSRLKPGYMRLKKLIV